MLKGVIFLIPVPIGNLGDITLRALEILKNIPLIACEDTRKSAFLLSQYEISAPKLLSFHKFNERQREEKLFAHLAEGKDLAIISDAGSPLISDPAYLFVQKAIEEGFQVQALPGATAFVPAISVSGFEPNSFQFLGFLPAKKKERERVFELMKSYPYPSIIYESVHHLKETLEELYAYLGNRKVAIVREISKLYEECIRGDLAGILADYQLKEKGEFVVVIDKAVGERGFDEEGARKLIRENEGMKSRELAGMLALKYAIPKNKAYDFVLKERR